jgi:hypothetical protein
MIPKQARRRALIMTLISFGLLLVGVGLGILWANIYSVR